MGNVAAEITTPADEIGNIAQRHQYMIDVWDHDPVDLKTHASCGGCSPIESIVGEVTWSAPDGTLVTRASDPDRFYDYERKYQEQNPDRKDEQWAS